MKLTKDQTAENRSDILSAAGRLFREKGFDGVAVPELMKAAGFTHGGFYNHFASKVALAAEACSIGMARSNAVLADKLRREPPDQPGSAWRRYVARYLSTAHRDAPETGCTVAALATEAGRQGPEVQASFAEGISTLIDTLAAHIATEAPNATPSEARHQAMRKWSEMSGALVLSRAVAEVNPRLSEEILAASRRGNT